MTSYNYRVMRHARPHGDEFAIHEIFYDESGKVEAWTEAPLSVLCASIEELKFELARYTLALEKAALEFVPSAYTQQSNQADNAALSSML